MKELVEVIAKSLVDYPDEVQVTETENDKAVVLELKVAQSDMGKVIGKQGRIAKAIRTVVKAAASKEDRKVIVEIMQWQSGVLKFPENGKFRTLLFYKRKGMENYDRIISGGCHYPDTWNPWRGQSISDD